MYCRFFDSKLSSGPSIELITRIQKSYDEYFGEISDDRLMSFGINPVLVHLGSIELVAFLDDETTKQTDGTDMVEKSKRLLKQRIVEMMKEKLTQSSQSDATREEEGMYSFNEFLSSNSFNTNLLTFPQILQLANFFLLLIS